jgi:hypothetical protein
MISKAIINMKICIVLFCVFVFSLTFMACESCECDCQGEAIIINQSGVDYNFEIRKGSSVIFKGSIKDPDDIVFGLEEGNFTFAYGEQSLNKEKNFSIEDCKETTVVLND